MKKPTTFGQLKRNGCKKLKFQNIWKLLKKILINLIDFGNLPIKIKKNAN